MEGSLPFYFFQFLPARRYASLVLAIIVFVRPSVSLSVCLSQVGILLRRLNLGHHPNNAIR